MTKTTTDEGKISVFDEEELTASSKEDMNYDAVILRHLDKITTCASTIYTRGKKQEFITLIRLLDARIEVFGLDIKGLDYNAQRGKIEKNHKEKWDKREKFWSRHKKPHPDFGLEIRSLNKEGEYLYSKEKQEEAYQRAWEIHTLIMKFLGEKGKLFERTKISHIGKVLSNEGVSN